LHSLDASDDPPASDKSSAAAASASGIGVSCSAVSNCRASCAGGASCMAAPGSVVSSCCDTCGSRGARSSRRRRKARCSKARHTTCWLRAWNAKARRTLRRCRVLGPAGGEGLGGACVGTGLLRPQAGFLDCLDACCRTGEIGTPEPPSTRRRMVTPCMLTDQPPAALAACAARGMSAHCASVSVPAACSTPPAMLLEGEIIVFIMRRVQMLDFRVR
jgi:hypothetical protein